MAWTKVFNFRSSSGYVTDGADATYVIGSDSYPQTRNGVTFGYTSTTNMGFDDLNNGVDARFAGRNYASPNFPNTFRVDLEAAASYDVRLANGNVSGGDQVFQSLVIQDNSTVLTTIAPVAVTAGTYYDATSINRTDIADWIANNAKFTGTFATTTFNLVIGGLGGYTVIATLSLDRAAVVAGTKAPPFNSQSTMRALLIR